MNKSQLVSAVSENSKMSKKDVENVFLALSEVVKKTLASGEDIRLVGLLTVGVVNRAAKKGRNPKTGEEIHIPAARKVKLTPGKHLQDVVSA